METAVINVSTTPTFGEYVRFLIWATRRYFRFLIPFAIFGVIVFLMAPVIPYQQTGALARYRASIAVLFLPGILFVFLPTTIYFTARKRWRVAPEVRESRTYAFTEDGIEIIGETFRARVTWTHIVKAMSWNDHVVLVTGQHQFYLVPKKDFESKQAYEQFLELLRLKVTKVQI